jgi:hypothetical protein
MAMLHPITSSRPCVCSEICDLSLRAWSYPDLGVYPEFDSPRISATRAMLMDLRKERRCRFA